MRFPECEDLSTPSSTRARRLPPGMRLLDRPIAASDQRPSRDLLAIDPRKFPRGLFFSGPGACTLSE